MTELQFSIKIAKVLLYGHLALFSFGLILVPAFGKLDYIDIFQVFLMGFPMLAVVSLAGFDHVMGERKAPGRGKKVDADVAQMASVVCYSAIAISFVVYLLPIFEIAGMTKDVLKIIIGLVESVLGVYLGKIRDHLFPPRIASEG